MYKHISVTINLTPRVYNTLKKTMKFAYLYNSKYPILVIPNI